MRLLQLHEYLDLLDGGVATQAADHGLAQTALATAESLWPTLKISPWDATSRTVEMIARCTNSGKRLVHVTADWKNCYLILVFECDSEIPESYILFDIGAEYSEVQFVCPAFEIAAPATEDLIAKYIPRLKDTESDPFAVLDIGDGTYMQAYAEGSRYGVEYQLVSLASHYALDVSVDAATVVMLFNSYAFGRKEWAREYTWTKVEL